MVARSLDSLRLYGRYLAASLRGQLQYRASFVLQTVGHFAVVYVELFAIVALFARFSSLDGWTLAEVTVFYGFISISFAVADAMARGFDLFGNMVRQGEFDRLLLRPRSTVLQLLGQELTLKRVGRLLPGFLLVGWGMHELDLALTASRVVLATWLIAGSVALFLALVMIQATMCFWTVETLELMSSLTYGGSFAARYPMSIYDSWLRRFFTFVVPLTCTSYFPVVAFLGRPDPLGTSIFVQWLAPAAGVLFLLAAGGIWRFGVRHYRSTGS